jgi:hypothetical protein
MAVQDLPAMWAAIGTRNKMSDPVFASKLRSQFQALRFDPTKTTIREFVDELEYYRRNLADTPCPLDDEALKDQLLLSLPTEAEWRIEKNWCIRERLTFN